MRLFKCITPLGSTYLSAGDTYRVETVNGGKYDQIYFKNDEHKCGTYITEAQFKTMLRNGGLIAVD